MRIWFSERTQWVVEVFLTSDEGCGDHILSTGRVRAWRKPPDRTVDAVHMPSAGHGRLGTAVNWTEGCCLDGDGSAGFVWVRNVGYTDRVVSCCSELTRGSFERVIYSMKILYSLKTRCVFTKPLGSACHMLKQDFGKHSWKPRKPTWSESPFLRVNIGVEWNGVDDGLSFEETNVGEAQNFPFVKQFLQDKVDIWSNKSMIVHHLPVCLRWLYLATFMLFEELKLF